jgi:hypothetical protein
MPTQHDHKPGLFDAGHCHACAFEAGLLGHYQHVQREEAALHMARRLAGQAQRRATWALWLAGAGILLAAIALLKG